MRFTPLVDLMFKMHRSAVTRGEPQQTVGLFGPPGIGKCLGRGLPVLLADGRVLPVEEIVTGDRLMGPDGEARNVISTMVGRGPLFRIDPLKGEPWVCNDVHVLTLVNTYTAEIVDIPLDVYLAKGSSFKHDHKLFSVGVNLFENTPPPPMVNPYFLGVWFGDGTKVTRPLADGSDILSGVQITKPDPEIRLLCEETARVWETNLRIKGREGDPTY